MYFLVCRSRSLILALCHVKAIGYRKFYLAEIVGILIRVYYQRAVLYAFLT